jgi:hypothetical protein
MSMIQPLRGPHLAGALATPGAAATSHPPEGLDPHPTALRRLGSAIPRPAIWAILAVVLLSWHPLALEPGPGLGRSWEAAMHMAHHFGITYGNGIIFTYGPLGFLSAPTLWYAGTGTIAFVYTLLARVVVVAAVFLAARRTFGTLPAALAALLVADASGKTAELVPVTVPFLILAVYVLDREWGRGRLLAVLALAGAIAGFEVLNKASIGLEMGALAVVMALAARERRAQRPGSTLTALAVTLGALLLTLLIAWTAAGQGWGALPAFVRNSEQIVSGYAAGQGFENSGLKLEFAAALVAFAIGLAATLQMTGGERVRRRRWGIIALWLVFCFFQFKEGFVRHDTPHGSVFFVTLLGGFFALRWRPGGRTIAALMAGILLALAVLAQRSSPGSLFDPVGNAKSAITQIADVAIPSKRDAAIANGRRAIESAYPLDPTSLSLLRGHTVHVLPFQVTAAWAYRLDWRPLPVFHAYSAYTPTLDKLDADAVASARAPQRILRNRDPEVDHKFEPFDQPMTTRAILCRYQELRTTSEWQLLGLGADRCQAPIRLGAVHAGWGQRVSVPPPPNPHSFVFVRVDGVGLGSIERVIALFYKPPTRRVQLDRGSYRLVEGTAADGLVLRAAPGVDFSAPFNIAANSSTIAVAKTGQAAGSGRPITYSFFAETTLARPRAPVR